MSNLDCKKPKPCLPESVPDPVPCSEPFDLCVGDRTLHWDGFCPTVGRYRHTPDGTYTSVTVVDGCVVGYGYAEEATYTPPYCAPNPTNCQGGGSDVGSASISSSTDNTLVQTSGGLFARTYVIGGTGVTVAGIGTVTSPYVISAVSGRTDNVSTLVGRNGISLTPAPEGVTYIGLEASGAKAGVYDITDQFSVDKFGRITSVVKRSEPIVAAGAGLTASNHGDTVQLEHPTYDVADSMVLGAYVVGVSNTGHITKTERAINVPEGIYQVGAYELGINSYGSISSIVQRNDVMPSKGSFTTADGKTISYDVTGRLTGIEGGGEAGSATRTEGLPLPLRDMYKVALVDNQSGGYSVTMEIYGTYTQIVRRNGTVRITLPSYVTGRDQISVQGASSWEIDISAHVLVVIPSGTLPFTVALRG